MVAKACLHARVYGRVQGVFYRSFVFGWARKLELTGFARNLPDGTVEVRAEGDKASLEIFIVHLEEGPPASAVEKVSVNWYECSGDFNSFRVL